MFIDSTRNIYSIALLSACLLLYLLRAFLYPKHVCNELRTNLIEKSYRFSVPIAQTSMLELAALQYSDRAGLTIFILALDIPNYQLKIQALGVQSLPFAVSLPSVAMIPSAAGGEGICRKTHISPCLKVPAIIVEYVEVDGGLLVAAGYAVLVMFQHFNQVQLTADKIFQDMIFCEPFGQGSFALQELGEAVLGSFGAYHRGRFPTAKQAIQLFLRVSFHFELLTWKYAIFWRCFVSLAYYIHSEFQPRGA
ncbi:malic acid transport protein [Penicillium lividum]|nr:malic acid transport protein [Penicillium lividum]